MTARVAWTVLKDAGGKFIEDQGPRLGAALAYYTALSLSPLVLAVVAIVGLVYGKEAARGEIVDQFRDTIGPDAAAFVQQLVQASASSQSGTVATIIALVLVLFGASGVFAELRSALNAIWKVPTRTNESGVRSALRGRLLSFSLVCGTAALLLASLIVTAVIAGIDTQRLGWVPGINLLASLVNLLLSFVLTAGLFAMVFKWLPSANLAWRDVWIGALVTSALFSVGRLLIGLYLGVTAVGSPYGAAGAFVVLLVWIYYSTQILIFGAELTFVYAQRVGSGVRGGAS